jgi:SLT domain-containing protein
VPGHRDVWNPVDNIVAGVRYSIHRYGSFDQIPGVRAVNSGRPYVGY